MDGPALAEFLKSPAQSCRPKRTLTLPPSLRANCGTPPVAMTRLFAISTSSFGLGVFVELLPAVSRKTANPVWETAVLWWTRAFCTPWTCTIASSQSAIRLLRATWSTPSKLACAGSKNVLPVTPPSWIAAF